MVARNYMFTGISVILRHVRNLQIEENDPESRTRVVYLCSSTESNRSDTQLNTGRFQ